MKSVWMLVLFAISLGAQAQIYTWVDAKGKVHYSDKAPQDQSVKTVDVEVESNGLGLATKEERETARLSLSYDAHLRKKAKREEQQPPPLPSIDHAAETQCRKTYGLSCAEVERQLQANIDKCVENRGGKSCHDKEFQKKKLMPLSYEDKAKIEEYRAANLERQRAARMGW